MRQRDALCSASMYLKLQGVHLIRPVLSRRPRFVEARSLRDLVGVG
jgi:hypothetical protein